MVVIFRRLVALFALLAAMLSLAAVPALADPGATVGPQSLISDTMIVAWLVTIISGSVIPAITDFITKASAPKWFKVLIVGALSALAAVIPTVTFSHGERWTDYLFQVFLAFVASQTAHRTGYSQPIQDATGDFGIGPSTDTAAPVTANAPGDPLATDSDDGDTGGAIPPENLAVNPNDLPAQVDPRNGGTL